MPRLHNDGTGGTEPETLRLTVTRTQYEMVRRWAAGRFLADWVGVPDPPAEVTADGLDRAALEGGCGGGFFPGMEAGWILRNPAIYDEPFRFRQLAVEDNATGVTPGDVTKRSAIPWQADFLKCGNNWWPAQRPNQVRPSATATATWSGRAVSRAYRSRRALVPPRDRGAKRGARKRGRVSRVGARAAVELPNCNVARCDATSW